VEKKRLRNGRENEKIRGNNFDKKETKKRRKFMISRKNILINLKNVSYKCHDLHDLHVNYDGVLKVTCDG